jgi:hypothetical protein
MGPKIEPGAARKINIAPEQLCHIGREDYLLSVSAPLITERVRLKISALSCLWIHRFQHKWVVFKQRLALISMQISFKKCLNISKLSNQFKLQRILNLFTSVKAIEAGTRNGLSKR